MAQTVKITPASGKLEFIGNISLAASTSAIFTGNTAGSISLVFPASQGISITGSLTVVGSAKFSSILDSANASGTLNYVIAANGSGGYTWTDLNTIFGAVYVPLTRTITIDGVSQDLSANRTWNILPTAGSAGQILAKNSNTNYDVTWIDNYTSTVKHLVKLSTSMTAGTPVYVSGQSGTNMIVSKSTNSTEMGSSKTIGLLETGGGTNAIVYVIAEGLLAGLNTSTAAAGDPVWLGPNGTLIYGLANKPSAPNHLVFIGIVTRVQQNNGEIFVKVQNGFELEELHNVAISSPSTGQLLRRDSDGLWKNWTPNYLTAEADTLATVTARGATTSSAISITNATQSNSSTSGALTVVGGVGIGGNLYVGGNLVIGGTTTTVNAQNLTVSDNMIYLNNGIQTTIINVEEEGGTLRYLTSEPHNYSVGMSVTITGSEPADFNFSNREIIEVQETSFTIAGTVGVPYITGGIARAKSNANPDLGFAAGYNDGSYAHTGLFRDASDGVYKFFKGYTPEPDADVFINTAHASFQYASLRADQITGTSFIKVGGTASQFLKADGSVDSSTYLTAESDPYRITAAAVTGTTTKTLTITRADSTTVTASWTDYDTNTFVNAASFNTGNGVLTLTRNDAGTVTVDLDGRYSEVGHTHALSVNESGYISIAGSEANIFSINSRDRRTLIDRPNTFDSGLYLDFKNPAIFPELTADGYKGQMIWRAYGLGDDVSGGYPMQIVYDQDGNIHYRIGIGINAWADGFSTIASRQWVQGQNYLTSYTETDPYRVTSAAVTGTTTKTLTLTRADSSTVTATWTDYDSDSNTFVNSASFNTADGVLTLTRNDSGTVTVDLDGRYQLAGSYLTAEADTLDTVTGRGATTANAITVGGLTSNGDISLGANQLVYTQTNVSAPSTTDQHAGSRIILYPYVNGGHYAIGIESGHMWFNTDGGFKWYNDSVLAMHLDTTNLKLVGNLYATGIATINGNTQFTTGGNAALSVNGNVISFGSSNNDLSYFRRNASGQFQWQSYLNGNNGEIHIQPYGGKVSIGSATPTAKLTVSGSTAGESLLEVYGTNGLLFAVSDDLSNSLFSANTIAGLPVIEAFADGSVVMGPFSSPVTVTTAGQINTTNHGNSSQWIAGYNDRIVSAAVSGGPTKTLTLTQQDGGTVTASWSDTDTDTNTYLTNAAFNTSTGVLTLTRNDAVTVTVDLDDRYALSGSYLTAESDTLATVTGRGNTTTTRIGVSTSAAINLAASGNVGTWIGGIEDSTTGWTINSNGLGLKADNTTYSAIVMAPSDGPIYFGRTNASGAGTLASWLTVDRALVANFTNRPQHGGSNLALVSELPTVNNATLTMNVSGNGLSGSQTFTANQSSAATFTVTSNATSANTASTIVFRDGSGNFTAGTITATLAGSATSATQVVTLQDTPPAGVDGKLWWETDTGKLKVYYGASSAWVDALPMPDMTLYLSTAGGAISGDLSIAQTLTVTGNILTSGNLTVSGTISASGYNNSNWNAAYADKINSAAFNTTNGILTLTQQDGGTVTVDLDGRYLTSETDSQSLQWDAASKNLTISNGNTVTLDGLATEEFVTSQGYITGYTEADTLNSVTTRGNTTANSVRFGTHVDLSPTGGAFRFYDGTTFRGGFGTDAWGHSGSDANLVLYVNGDNTLFFSTAGTKRASVSSSAFNSLVALQQNGNQVWHAGNDGSGSGLDADLLDGYNSDNFIGKNGNTYFQLTTWLQSTGTHGFYSPSSGAGTHFYPSATTYGSFRIEGGKNGFSGIELAALTKKPTWMWDGSGGGMYSQTDSVWYYYYSISNGTFHIGSTTENRVWHSGNFTDNSSNWNAAYNDRITAVSVAGGPTKTITLTQQDGGTLTASWSDTDTDTNTYLTSASFNTGNGVLTLTRNDSVTVTVDLDGRFYTQSEADGRYVNVTGDVMTGTLGISTGTAGIDAFYVDGTYGRLFTVTDDLTDAVFSVNTISGLPIIEAYSDYSVRMGRYNQNDFYISTTGNTGFGTASPGYKVDITGSLRLSGTIYVGGYIEQDGQSMNLRKVNSITFAPNNTWNDAYNHGIMSTDLNATNSDAISINSYNDITLRIDSNGNNSASYVRFMNDTTGSNQFAYIGYDGSTYIASFNGNVFAGSSFRAPIFYDSIDTNYYVDPNSSSVLYSTNIDRAQITNDVTTSSGQGRFGGWYTGTGYTGAAVEVGFSGGNGYVIAYNRNSSTYQPLIFNGSNIYLNPATGGSVYINTSPIIRQSAGTGWLSGNYSSSETSATTGAIYSIGGSYYPTGSSLNTMYGVGYTNAAQGAMPTGAADWGFYVVSNGTARVWLGADSGNIIATGNIYAETNRLVATQAWVGSQGYLTSYSETDTLASVTARGNTTNASIIVQGGQGAAETTDGYGLVIRGNYTNGQYNHRLTKFDKIGGVPLYVQLTVGTANVWSNSARFGTYSGNGYEFEVYGAAKVNGDLVSSGQINASGGNSSQWNTAYGWGNHASAGYLTSVSDVWVNTSGDTMTGNLSFGATSNLGITWGLNTDAAFIKFISSGNQAGGSYLEIGTQDDSDEEIKFTQSGNVRMYVGTDGNIYANNSFRAPIFYDSANTNYYLDPNSQSVLYNVQVSNVLRVGPNYHIQQNANGDLEFKYI